MQNFHHILLLFIYITLTSNLYIWTFLSLNKVVFWIEWLLPFQIFLSNQEMAVVTRRYQSIPCVSLEEDKCACMACANDLYASVHVNVIEDTFIWL